MSRLPAPHTWLSELDQVALGDSENGAKCSRTLRAKRCVQRVEHLHGVPLESYQETWRVLAAQGIQSELPSFHRALRKLQDFIRSAPLDEVERADIHATRERYSREVSTWLSERRKQLQGHFGEESMTLLGLRDVAPPMMNAPVYLLANFEAQSKA